MHTEDTFTNLHACIHPFSLTPFFFLHMWVCMHTLIHSCTWENMYSKSCVDLNFLFTWVTRWLNLMSSLIPSSCYSPVRCLPNWLGQIYRCSNACQHSIEYVCLQHHWGSPAFFVLLSYGKFKDIWQLAYWCYFADQEGKGKILQNYYFLKFFPHKIF